MTKLQLDDKLVETVERLVKDSIIYVLDESYMQSIGWARIDEISVEKYYGWLST